MPTSHATRFAFALVSLAASSLACRTAKPQPPTDAEKPAAATNAVRLTPRPAPDVAPEPAPMPRPESVALAPLPADAVADDAIVVAGERFSIGTPVVLWSDPGGYDAYAPAPFFEGPARAGASQGLRYRPGRKRGDEDVPQPTRAEVAELVDQFVLHFDVCGVSRQCFKVLHDIRGLSVHFMLDIDGTIYQTLDLRDTAWHARQANARSVGIEIANIGAYPPGERSALDSWYVRDDEGWRIELPANLSDGGVRTVGFTGRPARPTRVEGPIQGQLLEQFDFTPQQYEALVKLTAALCKLLPKIEPDAPRDARGRVRTEVLDAADFEAFRGVLGHNHVTLEKNDPGPAMDWERLLEGVRALL